jgi:serine/threonine protein kinase/tetratricopeptide (TPR) repeat protein
MIGKTISHYKVIEKLGEGGMGEVYLAEDTKLNRKVALKFLPDRLAADSSFKARFKREAQAAAGLNHPNIITVHEVAEYENRPFIAMEYVEGQSLKEVIAGKDLSVEEVLDIGLQISDGLAKAHQAGIVHRDIKPHNVLIDKDGRARICDFGLAKAKTDAMLTQTGTTVGTVAYMSPEQARGEEADQRSDIFSLGVILYEMFTRKLPFKGEHEAAIFHAIINEQPQPPARFNNRVSPEVERIVFKALAKDKEERYQHADDLRADLKVESKGMEYAKTASVVRPAEVGKSKKTAALPLILGGLGVIILVLVYLAFVGQKQPSNLRVGRPSLAVLYLQNMSDSPEDEYFAAGMTEDIITQLSKISGLRVVSRSEMEQFKDQPVSMKAVADKLGVDYVMEGSVRKHGNKLRITCQLIQADDGFHVWADSYDRGMEDLFDIQADVAREVASALEVALAPAELEEIEKKPTLDVRAYNYYLQGREYYFGQASSREYLELAIGMFERALEVDSSFALAYAGLSDCYSSYVMFAVDVKMSWLEEAEKAANKALSLDPELAEAHRALSRLYSVQGKTEEAIQAAERAVEANPHYAEAWRLLGNWYMEAKRYAEAEEALLKALEVKPTESGLFTGLMQLYQLWGRHDKVDEYFRRGVEVQPTNEAIYGRMSAVLLLRGDVERAKQMAYKALELDPESGAGETMLFAVFFLTEEVDSAAFYLQSTRQATPGPDFYINMAIVALKRGDKSVAHSYLDSSVALLEPMLRELEGTPGQLAVRSAIALVLAMKEERERAIQEVKILRENLGDSLLTMEWSQVITFLSFTHVLLGQNAEAVELVRFLLENNLTSPAMLRLHPLYKKLEGYPPYEELTSHELP